ncbi:hypothetical protein RI367_002968 [Sorochytrium milnesiophthora]
MVGTSIRAHFRQPSATQDDPRRAESVTPLSQQALKLKDILFSRKEVDNAPGPLLGLKSLPPPLRPSPVASTPTPSSDSGLTNLPLASRSALGSRRSSASASNVASMNTPPVDKSGISDDSAANAAEVIDLADNEGDSASGSDTESVGEIEFAALATAQPSGYYLRQNFVEVMAKNLKKRTLDDISAIQRDSQDRIFITFDVTRVYCQYEYLTQPLKQWVHAQARGLLKEKEAGETFDKQVVQMAELVMACGKNKIRVSRDLGPTSTSPTNKRTRPSPGSRSPSPSLAIFSNPNKRRREEPEPLVTRRVEIVEECPDPSAHVVPATSEEFNNVLFNGFSSTLARLTTDLQRRYDDLRGVCQRLQAENQQLRKGQPPNIVEELREYQDRCDRLGAQVRILEEQLAAKTVALDKVRSALS